MIGTLTTAERGEKFQSETHSPLGQGSPTPPPRMGCTCIHNTSTRFSTCLLHTLHMYPWTPLFRECADRPKFQRSELFRLHSLLEFIGAIRALTCIFSLPTQCRPLPLFLHPSFPVPSFAIPLVRLFSLLPAPPFLHPLPPQTPPSRWLLSSPPLPNFQPSLHKHIICICQCEQLL